MALFGELVEHGGFWVAEVAGSCGKVSWAGRLPVLFLLLELLVIGKMWVFFVVCLLFLSLKKRGC